MINQDIRDTICEMGYEDSVMFDNPDFDDAVVGISDDGGVIYDYELMVECLMKEDGISYEDAADFIGYNTIRSIPYAPDPKPIIMYKLIEQIS